MNDQDKRSAHGAFGESFSVPDARHDRWAELAIRARAWSAAARRGEETARLAADAAAALEELAPLDEFSAFPGPRLHRALRDTLQEGDATSFAHLAQRINGALTSGAFRHEVSP